MSEITGFFFGALASLVLGIYCVIIAVITPVLIGKVVIFAFAGFFFFWAVVGFIRDKQEQESKPKLRY